MKLKYMNQNAEQQQLQIPAIGTPVLVYKQVYDVSDNLAMLLLAMPFWEKVEVPPASEQFDRLTDQQFDRLTDLAVDDLQLVKGIGPQTAKALRKTGITTFALLIDTPAEQINKLLDGSLDYITVSMIRDWQENATTLKGRSEEHTSELQSR